MKTLALSESQHLAMDAFDEDMARRQAWKKRFLTAALVELGGTLAELWQFDEANRVFVMQESTPE